MEIRQKLKKNSNEMFSGRIKCKRIDKKHCYQKRNIKLKKKIFFLMRSNLK